MGRAGGRRRWTSVPSWTYASQHHGPVLWQRGTPVWLFAVGHAVANGIPLPEEAKVVDFLRLRKKFVLKLLKGILTTSR